MDIQLDFPRNATADQSITLASLLKRFCADERVGDQGKGYACSNCGGGSGAVSLHVYVGRKLSVDCD
jgi:ubiquitin carboxyl-terminal hydrolase 22/27/51